jgi:hypothetical protein
MGTEPHSRAMGLHRLARQRAPRRLLVAPSDRGLTRVLGRDAVRPARATANPVAYLWSMSGCEFVAPPALERVGGRRDRAAQSDTGTTSEGGSGAIVYESRDHRHAAGVYGSRVAQPVCQLQKRRASFEDLPMRHPDDLAR